MPALPELPELWSVSGDASGEEALVHLPGFHSRSDQLLVACDGLKACDIWSGVVIRALLEYAAVRLMMPVTLSLPTDHDVRREFFDALGGLLPNNVTLAAGATTPSGESKRVILPACRIDELGFAGVVASHLPGTPRSAGVERRELSFIAAALQTLVSNALLHASSPINAIAGVGFEPDYNEVNLVVADLGDRVARHDDAADVLDEAWRTNERTGRKVPPGLPGILLTARARSLDATLNLYSGTGRLFVRAGEEPRILTEQLFVPGFVANVRLHRED